MAAWFCTGFAVFASTAFGWGFVMRRLKPAPIRLVTSMSMVLRLTTGGVVFFPESLGRYEIIVRVMSIASMNLPVRFA